MALCRRTCSHPLDYWLVVVSEMLLSTIHAPGVLSLLAQNLFSRRSLDIAAGGATFDLTQVDYIFSFCLFNSRSLFQLFERQVYRGWIRPLDSYS